MCSGAPSFERLQNDDFQGIRWILQTVFALGWWRIVGDEFEAMFGGEAVGRKEDGVVGFYWL